MYADMLRAAASVPLSLDTKTIEVSTQLNKVIDIDTDIDIDIDIDTDTDTDTDIYIYIYR